MKGPKTSARFDLKLTSLSTLTGRFDVEIQSGSTQLTVDLSGAKRFNKQFTLSVLDFILDAIC
jgi:hypothetical protein